MKRRLVWVLVLDSVLGVLVVQRWLQLEDAWARQAQALSVHEAAGAP